MKFVRYGGLSSVRQRGYDVNSTGFHSPPARRGIYAFIWPYVEWFLLNGYEMDPWKPHAKYEWMRDAKGNRIESPLHGELPKEIGDKYMQYLDACDEKKGAVADRLRKELGILSDREVQDPKDKKYYYVKLKTRKEFEMSDDREVWHHLSDHVNECDVLARKGQWIMTTVDTLAQALQKEKQRTRVETASSTWNPHTYKDVRPFKGWVKDHLEVFFEKV